jgi:hypothetical protein
MGGRPEAVWSELLRLEELTGQAALLCLHARTTNQEGRCVVDDDIEEGSVDLQPVVAVDEAEFASLKTMPCRRRRGSTGDSRGREET